MPRSKEVVYKVKPDCYDVPARVAPHNNANIWGQLQADDRIYAGDDVWEGDYLQIVNVDTTDGHNDAGYCGKWVHKEWIKQVYDGREDE